VVNNLKHAWRRSESVITSWHGSPLLCGAPNSDLSNHRSNARSSPGNLNRLLPPTSDDVSHPCIYALSIFDSSCFYLYAFFSHIILCTKSFMVVFSVPPCVIVWSSPMSLNRGP
jgi:hypothetical protein